MAIEIKAPAFPESVADGTIATWHKQVGEAVKRDELLVDIETDKVVMEVMAPADGIVTQIIKAAGETVLSQELLGLFAEGAAASASAAPAPEKATPVAAPAVAAPMGPAARKMVTELGLGATEITGSGKGGRVTKEDVVQHTQTVASAAPQVSASSPQVTSAPLPLGDRVERRVPMTRLRARIAERLLEAKQSTAMLTTFNEVNMAPVMALRKQYAEKF